MDLEKYLFKYVRVETNYGEIIVGYVDMFCTAEENEEPYLDSIGIISNRAAREGIELDESEIKSIEEISLFIAIKTSVGCQNSFNPFFDLLLRREKYK